MVSFVNNLVLFESKNFGDIRAFIRNEDPWFVAKDIASILDYSKASNMLERLDEDDKIKLNYSDSVSLGLENVNSQGMYFINESGLYTSILGSKKLEAKQFKKWITSEVLPSIRKHGIYMTEDVLEKTLADPDFIIQLANQLKQEKEKRLLIEKQLEEQKPKVEIYDELIEQKDLLNFKQVANTFGVCGRNILFRILREEHVLSDNRFNWNLPYAQYMKYFKVKIVPRRTDDGVQNICIPLCTTKAIPFIRNILSKKKSLQLELQA